MFLALWLFTSFAVGTSGAVPEPPASTGADRVDAAVQGGVAFLLTQQQASGAIADTGLGAKYQTALTAFGGLALLGAGHSPQDKSPEGVALRRALNFVLTAGRQTADGYYGAADLSMMHGHAVTTLFLCEALRAGADPELEELTRRKAGAAHQFTLFAQGARKDASGDIGGWRYRPDARDSDVPVTAWQLLSLYAGTKAGFTVPPAAGNAAAQYLKNVHASAFGVFDYGPKPQVLRVGSLRPEGKKVASRTPYLNVRGQVCYTCHYTPAVTNYYPPILRGPDSMLLPPGDRNHFSTSAMGLLGMRLCGQPRAPEAVSAAAFLLQTMKADPTARIIANGSWPFHAAFFNTLALQQFGEPHTSLAQQFAERNFVVGQSPDGSWTDNFEGRQIGRVYCTSLAVLSLEAKYRRLAIYAPP
ncbi:MAG: hypothetical protein EBS05_09335 [Proteobacteria bacterium]|nr:hypothetical protein [Pseudomonadota bacterium]